ncbi:Hypothetical Protein FCC1311_097712 [Hondaea fermentalgiana]|uniref:DNA-directed primase/polymerase protein n=1 Tax=Hondaea fermentalgiana TaxID=2315210 RepID=A0A2R5GUV7_9STRA|nr:Hypothetical Protein FCC1311_097712 [Hondaea fermentalgiana]|eukprot:GBG33548.1 Hypothetical Protein FCC1311_097712 [Hondaea fermentalgiana]
MQWVHTQKAVLAATAPSDGIYLAEDINASGAKRYTSLSLPRYMESVEQTVRSKRPLYHNEILREGNPVRVYLDVERASAVATTEEATRAFMLEAETDFKALMPIFTDFIKTKLPPDSELAAPVILEGSRCNKFSRHVILHVKVANTKAARELVVNQFLPHLEKLRGWTRERSMIDTKVYTKNRCFRLMHSSKRTAALYPLRWLNPDGTIATEFDQTRFRASLVSRPAQEEPEIALPGFSGSGPARRLTSGKSTPTKGGKRPLRPTASPDPKRARMQAPSLANELESKSRQLFPCRQSAEIRYEGIRGDLHQVRVHANRRELACPFGAVHKSNSIHVNFRVRDRSLHGVHCYGCERFCDEKEAVQNLKKAAGRASATRDGTTLAAGDELASVAEAEDEDETAGVEPHGATRDEVVACLGFELSQKTHDARTLGGSWSASVRERHDSGRACFFARGGPRHTMLLMYVDGEISIECLLCRKRHHAHRTACFMDLAPGLSQSPNGLAGELRSESEVHALDVGPTEHIPNDLAHRVHRKMLDDSQRSILIDESNMGSGKTHTNLVELVGKLLMQKPEARVLIEVSRVSLAMAILERLRKADLLFDLYSEIYDKSKIKDSRKLIMQVDSSRHLTSLEPWDLIIVDEGTAHLKQFLSNNIRRPDQILNLAKARWALAKRLVVLCADMTPTIARIYTNLFAPRGQARSIYLRVCKPSRGIHVDYVGESELKSAVALALLTPESDANLWLCSNSREALMDLQEYLVTEANKKSVQDRFGSQFEDKICKVLNGIYLITSDPATTSSADRQQVFSDLNITECHVARDKEYIFDSGKREFRRRGTTGALDQKREKYAVRLFACSPSMTVGVSYDDDTHFDACVAILAANSPSPARDLSQMMNRVRKFQYCMVAVRESRFTGRPKVQALSYRVEEEAERAIAEASRYIETVNPFHDATYLQITEIFEKEREDTREFALAALECVRRNNPGNTACVPDPQAIFMHAPSTRARRILRVKREWALLAASLRPLPLDLEIRRTTDYFVTVPRAPPSEVWTEERVHMAKQHSSLLALLGHRVHEEGDCLRLRPDQIAFLNHLRSELEYIRTLWYGTRSSDASSRKVFLWGRHLGNFRQYSASDLVFYQVGLSGLRDERFELVSREREQPPIVDITWARRRSDHLRGLLVLVNAYVKQRHGQSMNHPRCMTQNAPSLHEEPNEQLMTFAYAAVHCKKLPDRAFADARAGPVEHFRFWMGLLRKLSVNMPPQLDRRKLGLLLAVLQESTRGASRERIRDLNGEFFTWPERFSTLREGDVPDVLQEELDKLDKAGAPKNDAPDADDCISRIMKGVPGTQCATDFCSRLARHGAMVRNMPEALIPNEHFDTLRNAYPALPTDSPLTTDSVAEME